MRVVAAVAILLLLAGCSSSPSPAAAGAGASPEGPQAELSEGHGAIDGVVVDSVIRPVAGVNLTLQHPGDAATTNRTDALGRFAFSDLAPGAYTLATQHGRYIDSLQAVVVTAGKVVPLRVVLEPRSSNLAFFSQVAWHGYVECSFGSSNLCAAVNLATGEKTTNDNGIVWMQGEWTGYNRAPDWMQTETTWEPTATAASSISMMHTAASKDEWEAGDAYHIGRYWVHDGPPLYNAWNHTFAADNGLGTVRDPVFLATNGQFSFVPDPPVSKDNRIGAAMEQSFDLYLTTFYGYVPPLDWRFLESGTVPEPA